MKWKKRRKGWVVEYVQIVVIYVIMELIVHIVVTKIIRRIKMEKLDKVWVIKFYERLTEIDKAILKHETGIRNWSDLMRYFKDEKLN